MFKAIRIAILLLILASVWTTMRLQKNFAHDWQGTIDIKVIPVVMDEEPNTKRFVRKLDSRRLENISRYLVAQGKRYGQQLEYSLNITQGGVSFDPPPLPPEPGASRVSIAIWSLRLRFWAWQQEEDDHSDTQIRLFVLYQSPGRNTPLPHSTGLQNGLLGLIQAKAYSSYANLNEVIMVHELLHILGASDKYDISTGQPLFPVGYAKPDQVPSLPQSKAEIMGRAIPISEYDFEVATHLRSTVIGQETAQEIAWSQ